MRKIASGPIVTVLVLAVVLQAGILPAQEEAPLDPEGQSSADVLSLPASAWAVGPRPDPVERVYPKSPKKVWRALVKTIERMEIPIDVATEESGLIKTRLVAFDQSRNWGNLATDPPPMTPERPIMQRVGLRSGNYSVSIGVAPEDGGTRVVISAYLEEEARYVPLAEKIKVERYSNGQLEQIIFEALESRI